MHSARSLLRRYGCIAVAAALLAASAIACGGSSHTTRSVSGASTTEKTTSDAGAHRFEDFNPANFDNASTTINNRYMPLVPGTQYTLEGSDLHDGKRVPHRTVFTVTDLTRVVDGVRTVVIWDLDFTRTNLDEAELTFFAQDKAGNVWHLGQYSEVYEEGDLIGARGFLVGYLDGAHAGIMMQAHPQPDTPSYSEGWAPSPINWNDRARVWKVGQHTTVPAGGYNDVLVTKEYSESEPDTFQTKYYAPGVGNVRVGFLGNDPESETLLLTAIKKLDADAMAKVRSAALQVDTRAKMYGSAPAIAQSGASG
jgi:hypothetical protein